MNRAEKILYIVIHCSAGFGNYASMEKYWFTPKSKGGLGWKTGGYHRVVMTNGDIVKAYPFSKVTNGVGGFNDDCIHICYQGGVDPKNTKKAMDSRTDAQKAGIMECIVEAFEWIKTQGIDPSSKGTKVIVLGHRDFSDDKNHNGVIDPNERIKECPSFDAFNEYKWITYTDGQNYTLPKNR